MALDIRLVIRKGFAARHLNSLSVLRVDMPFEVGLAGEREFAF